MEVKNYLSRLFASAGMPVEGRRQLFESFCTEEKYTGAVQQIQALQQMLMTDYKRKSRIYDIQQQPLRIPNGTVGKPYEARLEAAALGWDDLTFSLEGLDDTGLAYDDATGLLSGTPRLSGDFKLQIRFRFRDDEAGILHEKPLPLIINPDPRSLWKAIPSDPAAPYAKPDTEALYTMLGDKHFVAASRRGRSHANAGTFRDDHFACAHDEATGWSIAAVSDGAGSAPFAREGARLACHSVLAYCSRQLQAGVFATLDPLVAAYRKDPEAVKEPVDQFLQAHIGGAARYAATQINDFAAEAGTQAKDFHATLIFTLFKKYEEGYAILTFGVGDCPIVLVYERQQRVALLNTIDVGEFGGGTRFITMPEIFQSNTFAQRAAFRLVPDFDYLVLMTDGIYDPKFEVEANLEKPEKWKAFFADLAGANPEERVVHLEPGHEAAAEELLAWTDFWSPGNYDDRTLALIF